MSKKVFTQAEKDLAQQPLEKDGYSSDRFNKLYGKGKNPHLGSERDRSKRNWRLKALSNANQEKYEEGWDRIFGHKNGKHTKKPKPI